MVSLTNISTCSLVLHTCKHTRTRSLPLGTVGHVMARTFSPIDWRCAESGRGEDVRTGMMGLGSAVESYKWGGRDKTSVGMWMGDFWRRNFRSETKCWERDSKVFDNYFGVLGAGVR